MVNYSQAKIYKIIDNTNGNIYVGSTCEPTLARRLAGHVGKYQLYLKGKYHPVTSFEIIKNGNYDIILIENVKCDSKDQLTARERYYIESLDCVNQVIPGRTRQEYRDDNKDKIQQYYEDNKQKILEQNQVYRKDNKEKIKEYNNTKCDCECGGKFTQKNKAQHLKSTKHKKYIRNKMIQEYELLLNMEKNRIKY
jgi:hypothetical protein